MFRFSMRELFLLMALAGSCLAWRTDSDARAQAQEARRAEVVTRQHAERLRESLRLARDEYESLLDAYWHGPRVVRCAYRVYPEWDLTDQPIP